MTGQDRSAVAVPATTPRRRTSPAQPALASASTAETPAGAVGTPWLLVVARGQDHLVVALRALFRNDERIQVVEDRRDERGLLPRADTVRLAPSSRY